MARAHDHDVAARLEHVERAAAIQHKFVNELRDLYFEHKHVGCSDNHFADALHFINNARRVHDKRAAHDGAFTDDRDDRGYPTLPGT